MTEGLDAVIGGGVADEGRADTCFSEGRALEESGDRPGAIGRYREAVEFGGKPEHIHRLAYLLDLVGEEDEAIEMYEMARESGNPRLQTLINLGVIYEDRGDFAQAEYVLKQVIEIGRAHV